jgi:hypothetical protein
MSSRERRVIPDEPHSRRVHRPADAADEDGRSNGHRASSALGERPMQLDAADVQIYAAALPESAMHDWVERAAGEEEAAAGEQADGTGERDAGADPATTGAMVDADDNPDESAWLGPSGYNPWYYVRWDSGSLPDTRTSSATEGCEC